MSQVLTLRKLFEYVADHIGLHFGVIIFNDSQPVGCGIEPLPEVRDVMRVLENNPNTPSYLRQNTPHLVSRVLEDPDVRAGHGNAIAVNSNKSGYALTRTDTLIDAQSRQNMHAEPGPFQINIRAERGGVVVAIDNYQVERIARLAGASIAEGAGVYFLKKLGDLVAEGEPLYRIHTEVRTDFEFARNLSQRHCGYRIEDDYGAVLA